MKEIILSRYRAASIVEKYYDDYYSNVINVKVKSKIINNDLYMTVKLQSTLKHKKINKSFTISEGEITKIINNYMVEADIYSIMYEPYFHNLYIRYNGIFNIDNLENKKKYKLNLKLSNN